MTLNDGTHNAESPQIRLGNGLDVREVESRRFQWFRFERDAAVTALAAMALLTWRVSMPARQVWFWQVDGEPLTATNTKRLSVLSSVSVSMTLQTGYVQAIGYKFL